MALPVITPASTTTTVRLSASATAAEVAATSLPFNIAEYSTDQYFLSGAAEQVAYVYKMLGGDVLDIELTNQNVYSAYQAACMEYSYLVNIHQAKNSLSNMLGATTSTFDHKGHLLSTISYE